MRPASSLAGLIVLALSGCSPYAPVHKAEDGLALAGFQAHDADTTARFAMMNLLPANRLTYRMRGLQAVMLYADPLLCGCVYMGDRTAYAAWRSQHTITVLQEREMTAEILQHPGWDWSVWRAEADPAEKQALQGRTYGTFP